MKNIEGDKKFYCVHECTGSCTPISDDGKIEGGCTKEKCFGVTKECGACKARLTYNSRHHVYSVLEKSPFGAIFFSLDQEKSPKEGFEVATPENLKWKKYVRQSENANGSPLEPLWGSKKLKVSTKRTLRPTNLPFWFGEKSS